MLISVRAAAGSSFHLKSIAARVMEYLATPFFDALVPTMVLGGECQIFMRACEQDGVEFVKLSPHGKEGPQRPRSGFHISGVVTPC